MTQEELNKLILDNIDDEMLEGASCNIKEHYANLNNIEYKGDISSPASNVDVNHYRIDAEVSYPPPPPIDDYKIVHQLDNITKDLEIKATQVFEQIETINANVASIQKDSKAIKKHLESQKALFEKLIRQFPHIAVFRDSLKICDESIKQIISINQNAEESSNCSLQVMDIMQYQDVHRQKIERVVNIIRILAKYLNSMFETNIGDDKRVTSATYLEGDTKDDVINSDELESLINNIKK